VASKPSHLAYSYLSLAETEDVDVAGWLRSLGLGQYEEAFRDNDIDGEVLRHLTADDLVSIGVSSVGHRRRLLSAAAALASQRAAGNVAPAGSPATVQSAGTERRQLTVMFCDLVDSTALVARLDPEDTREVISAYQNTVTRQVARFEGHVAKFMGDGVLVYFGWPRGHEDDAERAVRAGFAIVDAVAKLATSANAPLKARVGIATGIVVVGDLLGEGSEQKQAVVGETPNLAARLQALAEAGTIIVAESTHKLLGGLFELADLGTRDLKGFASPIRAWRVVGERQTEGRFEALHGHQITPLIGREHEVGLLLERFERARAGEGQVVLLSGEPGIGKSRLALALRERLDPKPRWILRYQGSPYHGNSSLWPIVCQLERAAEIAPDDPPEVKLDKVERLLDLAVANVADVAPLIAELLSVRGDGRYAPLDLTPQQRKSGTFAALLAQLEGLAMQNPTLIVLEDAHWLDPTTLEFFGLVVERTQRLPVLLVVTFRPEFSPPWTNHAHVMALALSGLARTQAAAVVARVAGGKALPAPVMEQILSKTEGLPLFVEELTKAVLESGLLVIADDHYELAGPLQPFAIPATLRDSLMARLDRPGLIREVAQVGAVIGREFGHDLLAAVAGIDAAHLEDTLSQLIEAELVFRRGIPPEVTYVFKHALVQDAAYGGLLRAQRQELHARVARELETRSPELADTAPELLAHHLTAAGFADRAVTYWQRAGHRAAQRSAHVEAIAHFTQALDLLASLPDDRTRVSRELNLLLDLGPMYIIVHGMASPQVADAYSRARELARQVGAPDQAYVATWGLWLSHQQRGCLSQARRLADEVLALASARDDPDLLLQAHHAAWTTLFFQDNIQTCLEHTERGIALYDINRHGRHALRFGGHDPGSCARSTGALALCLCGYPDKAVERSCEAIALARRLELPGGLSTDLIFDAMLHQYRREPNAVAKRLDELAVVCAEHGIRHYEGSAAMLRGWTDVTRGRLEQGLADLRRGLAIHDRSPVGLRKAYYAAMLIEAHLRRGDVESGLAQIDESLTRVRNIGDHHWRPELLRLRGELLSLVPSNNRDLAERAFQEALACAREQKCRLLELRAAVSLGRLWAISGELQQAQELLAPIYAEYTEGFDTADLKDAKTLLEEIQH
jgi:predicted ATPase/class 3 adenylate cyclase